MSAAARAAASGPSGALPQGSALLWFLLQHCLRQQAEALIEQQRYKASVRDAMAQVRCLSARWESIFHLLLDSLPVEVQTPLR